MGKTLTVCKGYKSNYKYLCPSPHTVIMFIAFVVAEKKAKIHDSMLKYFISCRPLLCYYFPLLVAGINKSVGAQIK